MAGGLFISTSGQNASVAIARAAKRHPHAGVQLGEALTPLVLAPKPPPPTAGGDLRFHQPSGYALESAFEEAVPAFEYPEASWWWRPPHAAGAARSALLYPLFEAIDEHYSVYWDLA